LVSLHDQFWSLCLGRIGFIVLNNLNKPRIYLSSPHMGGDELPFIQDAFATNWIAPLGPHVDGFEQEFASLVGNPYAAALSSGTAALHLALKLAGVKRGDDVFCSSFTFSASANPIVYEGASPVFIDSERTSWNMDPDLLGRALKEASERGKLPAAVVAVHLYGQSADIEAVAGLCQKYSVPLIEDAAEALGAEYWGSGTRETSYTPGTKGLLGIYSFNGNKIITTSGGGMLVSSEKSLIEKARFWATQSRDQAPHYQHSEIGYNYRMSNVLAAIGRGQLKVLKSHVEKRRANCAYYQRELSEFPGVSFMPEAPWGRCTRWLTCITIDPAKFGVDREAVRLALAAENIETRPLWKPMHLQPVFAPYRYYGAGVSDELFNDGLCLPSGSNLTNEDLARVVAGVRSCHRPSSIKQVG
jgi:pyridoxal phosphate-dependent aminotransferase EpsN